MGDFEAVPVWCEHRRGRGNLILVVPHGGRRPPVDPMAPPPNLRANDLYTPEFAELLALRLQAGVIVNRGADRNVLDLNRTSQVLRRARWFLALLAQEIDALLSREQRVELVFIHGWNTGQPRCDLGVGASESEFGLTVPEGARLTVSSEYLQRRLQPLRQACGRLQIKAGLGARYPASHPNNLLQLFSAHDRYAADPLVQRLVGWAAAGRIEAWQLELGIPLRWPGRWRERMLDALTATFLRDPGEALRSETSAAVAVSLAGGEHARGGSDGKGRGEEASGEAPAQTNAATLQFYDPAANIAMFAGVGRVSPGSIGARLRLFLGGQRIALFTGEEGVAETLAIPPLRLTLDGTTLRLAFDGPMLMLDDAVVYLDLEAALAASRLVEAAVDLEMSVSGDGAVWSPPLFGRVAGRLAIAGRKQDLEAGGFVNAGALRSGGGRGHTSLSVDLGDGRALLLRGTSGDAGATSLWFRRGSAPIASVGQVAVSAAVDPYVPDAIEITFQDAVALRAWPVSRMAILRAMGGGRYARATFGVARCRWGDWKGCGLYEHVLPLGTVE